MSSRLFDQFQPEHYDIHLTLDDQQLKYTGTVSIRGELPKEQDKIDFHAIGIETLSAKVDDIGAEVKTLPDEQQLSLHLPAPKSGPVTIEIEYRGEITPTMEGIYPSHYEVDGVKKTLLSTQFESHHAREAFPCIDEPAAKATFDLTLTTPAKFTVLGNTPQKTQAQEDQSQTTSFETTPKMSTYLLAFVVGELIYKEAQTENGIKTRVYAVEGNEQRMDYALETTAKCLDFYDNYFGINYPLEKCDMVAIPEFAVGAMENWGLVTYRESALLVDPERTSLANKKRVTEVIAHELAHQWFGNLVTMMWWDDLWLNESFATFMSNLAMDALHPEWDVWADFLSAETDIAMSADAQLTTRPIIANVEDPREISEFFEPAITYAKGSSVLRMLYGYIGNDKFSAGITAYLKKHSFANATHSDLWDALSESSGQDIKSFMEPWTKQPGFPIVSIDSEGSSVKLRQNRFTLSTQKTEDSSLWPINIVDDEGRTKLLDKAEDDWSEVSTDKLIKLNPEQTGFYRVDYSKEYLAAIQMELNSSKFATTDRMGLIADVVEAVKAGQTEIEGLIDLLSNCAEQSHPAVWDMIAGGLSDMWRVLYSDESKPLLTNWGRTVVDKQLNRLGWDGDENESHFDTLLRPMILSLAGRYEHEEVIAEAKARFAGWRKGQKLNPNIAGLVYTIAAQNGGADEFEYLVSRHGKEKLAEEQRRLAAAITSFKQPELTQKGMNLIRSKQVRIQDVLSWIFGYYRNRHAREEIWQWEQDNWEWIDEQFGEGHLYSYFVQGVAVFYEENKAQEVEKFFADKDTTGLDRSLAQSLEQIRWQAAWRQRDLAKLVKKLNVVTTS